MMRDADGVALPNRSYRSISQILLLLALFWPLLLLIDLPLLSGHAMRNWLLLLSALLLWAIVGDSLLQGVGRLADSFVALLWLSTAVVVLSQLFSGPALRTVYLFAVLFGLHSLRSALPLWSGAEAWWHWNSWWRDTLSATVLFLWCWLLAHA